jgi:hypothetical protein
VLLGFDDVTVAMGEFVFLQNEKQLRACLSYEKPLEAGQHIITPQLKAMKGEAIDLLEDFATLVAMKAGVAPKLECSPVGWCSW